MKKTVGVYLVVALMLWPVPLLNRLHAESCAVLALVAFFTSGLVALRAFRVEASVSRVTTRHLVALLVPLGLLTLSLFWAPNRGYATGLLLFGLFPVVSVVFGVALAFLLSALSLQRPGWWLTGIGVGLVVLGPLYDLGLHPQFYTYNHVFGGILGPIYDEELALRTGLFVFRGLTLLWAGLALLFGFRLRGQLQASSATFGIAVVSGGIGLVYLLGASLGLNTPDWYLQERLGEQVSLPHFDLYFDPESLSETERREIVRDHEFRFHQFQTLTRSTPDGRIASYLYPDPDTKAALTGARTTNVAPLWLRSPQTHVLLDSYARVFAHELAHVFSRPFGLPVVNASSQVGLVEGWAVALEPPDGYPDVHEQVAAAVSLSDTLGFANADRLVQQIALRLGAAGFWTGRGAVSYTTMGSFVKYLLHRYDPALFMQAYARGRFQDAYGQTVEELAEQWRNFILTVPVAEEARQWVAGRFSVPSLFERTSPHYVPPFVRWYRTGMENLEASDTTAALQAFEHALADEPRDPFTLNIWAKTMIEQDRVQEVRDRLEVLADTTSSVSVVVWVRLGDAYAFMADTTQARAAYQQALERTLPFERAVRALILMKQTVVGREALVRLVLSGRPAAERARLLAAQDSSSVARLWQGVLWAEAERFGEAFAALDGAGAQEHTEVDRQRLVWMGTAAQVLDRWVEALMLLQEARDAYAGIGDESAVEQIEDQIDKVMWLRNGTNLE